MTWTAATPNRKLRSTLAGVAIAVMALLPVQALAIDIYKPGAVIELFTSQGCSSCPAADRVLGRINEGREMLGLARHVDYWDRLGWKDTFGSAENTERQWLYARALGERQVYTPQAIINGRAHVVGSREQELLDAARRMARLDEGMNVPIDIAVDGDVLAVKVGASEEKATLYAVYFNPEAEVAIERGENGGRNLRYTNIVGKTEMIGMAGPGGMAAEFSAGEMARKGYGSCALLLQASREGGLPGPIIGAAVITGL